MKAPMLNALLIKQISPKSKTRVDLAHITSGYFEGKYRDNDGKRNAWDYN